MRFNPDPKKQSQEVIFGRKINISDHIIRPRHDYGDIIYDRKYST